MKTLKSADSRGALCRPVVTVLFFLWAIPNNLNDILIRQFMKSFNINRSSAASIQIYFYIGYFAAGLARGAAHAALRLQGRHCDGVVPAGLGVLVVLPGCASRAVRVFPSGAIRDRERIVLS